MKRTRTQLVQFLQKDIWSVRESNVSRREFFFIRFLRIFLLAIRDFRKNQCLLRASALTFYTLLSIVPLLAMIFGIAKGFGLENMLEEELYKRGAAHKEVIRHTIDFARTLLENTKGGLVAGIGVAGLFWTVIKLINHIELSFNDIWGIKTSRGFLRRFSDYLSLVLIAPVLWVMATSLNLLVARHVATAHEEVTVLSYFEPLTVMLLAFLPMIVIWSLFTFIYIYLPNTKVDFKAAFLGGFVAGASYEIAQWSYLAFQIAVSRFDVIYGSFAALPLFLIWLQVSWLIILFGAEIAFATQNEETYEFEQECQKISPSFKKLLSLAVTQKIVKAFSAAEKPWNATELARELGIPSRLIHMILFDLENAGVIVQIKSPQTQEKDETYQPARDIDSLTIQSVIDLLEHTGDDNLPIKETEELNQLKICLNDFTQQLNASSSNTRLKDL